MKHNHLILRPGKHNMKHSQPNNNPFNFEICVKYNQSSQRRIETCIDCHGKESMLQIYMESFTQLTINHSSSQGFNTHYLCCVWQFVPLSRLINTPSKCLSKLFISWYLSANVATVPQCVNQIHSRSFLEDVPGLRRDFILLRHFCKQNSTQPFIIQLTTHLLAHRRHISVQKDI